MIQHWLGTEFIAHEAHAGRGFLFALGMGTMYPNQFQFEIKRREIIFFFDVCVTIPKLNLEHEKINF